MNKFSIFSWLFGLCQFLRANYQQHAHLFSQQLNLDTKLHIYLDYKILVCNSYLLYSHLRRVRLKKKKHSIWICLVKICLIPKSKWHGNLGPSSCPDWLIASFSKFMCFKQNTKCVCLSGFCGVLWQMFLWIMITALLYVRYTCFHGFQKLLGTFDPLTWILTYFAILQAKTMQNIIIHM